MATNLTSPKKLAAQIESIGRGLMDESRRVAALEKTVEAMLDDGQSPLTVKSYMDTLLAGTKAVLQRYGDIMGDTTTPSVPALPMTFATRWKAGAPAGAGYYRVGYGSSYNLDTTTGLITQALRVIKVPEGAPNADMFLGIKVNDVIRVEGCTDYRNNGRYTIAYDVDDVGNGSSTYGLTQGDFSGSGSDWATSGSGLTVNTGAAVFNHATLSGSCSQSLANMSSSAVYEIKFDIDYSAGTNYAATVIVTIGGDWYFYLNVDSADKIGTYSFITNSPSTTPTLTITVGTGISGTPGSVSIDNVTVKGLNGLFVVEPFYSDAGGVPGESPYNDTGVVITLEQTAA
jgi:hypothetical protein